MTPLTSGFLLARERPDRCLPSLVQKPHKPQEIHAHGGKLLAEVQGSGAIEPTGIGEGLAAAMAVPKCWPPAPQACTSTSAATYRVRRGWTRGSGMDWR